MIDYDFTTGEATLPGDVKTGRMPLTMTLGEQANLVLNFLVRDNKYNDAEATVKLSDGRDVTVKLTWKVTQRGYHLEQRWLDIHDGRGMVYYPGADYLNKGFWS